MITDIWWHQVDVAVSDEVMVAVYIDLGNDVILYNAKQYTHNNEDAIMSLILG